MTNGVISFECFDPTVHRFKVQGSAMLVTIDVVNILMEDSVLHNYAQ